MAFVTPSLSKQTYCYRIVGFTFFRFTAPGKQRLLSTENSSKTFAANVRIVRWAHEICADDNEERAIVVASMNEMAYVLQAWLPLLVWPQIDAPEYQNGFTTVTVLSVALICVGIGTRILHEKQRRRYVGLY